MTDKGNISMASKTQDFTETQYKSIPGQISTNESQGIVECFVAAMGNKDSVGDICLPGCFNGSLKRRKPRVVWGHNWNEPIGKVLEIYEVGPNDPRLPAKMKSNGVGGLFAKVQFNLKSERGREAFSNVQFFGEEQEWSIGYKTLDAVFDNSKQANMLKEVELYEVSPVLHGANQLTGTISIKADESLKSAKVGPCWPGYKQIGMKKGKNGNMVPDCVPIDSADEKSALKDPNGGLTAAGRAHFKKTEGANLKPGVKGPANTPEKMRRKGSFLTRFFTNPSGPMKDKKGRPTRLALSARAWGEPVPRDAKAAAALAAKGRRLLERYENSKKKSDNFELEEKNHAIYSIGNPQENPIIGRMGNLAKELALHFGGEVAVREADNNTIVFDIIKDDVKETMKVNYHTVDGEQFMFGSAQPVKVETIYLPLDSSGMPSGAPIPQSPNMLEPPRHQSCGCGGACGSKQDSFSTWENFKNQNPGIHMFIKTENMEMFEAVNTVADYHGFDVELLDNGFAIPNIDWYEKDAQEAVISALEGIEQKFVFSRTTRGGRGALRATRKLPKLQKPSTRDGDGDNFMSNARGEDVVPVINKPEINKPRMMPPRRMPTEIPEREEKPQRVPIEVPKPQRVPVKPSVPTPVKPPVKPKVPERTSANRARISGAMRNSTRILDDLRQMENDPYSPSGAPQRARRQALEIIARERKLTQRQLARRLRQEIAAERMRAVLNRLRKRQKSLSFVYVSVADGNDIAVKTALSSNSDEPVVLPIEKNLIFETKKAIDSVAEFYKFKTTASDKGINIFGIAGLSKDAINAISNVVKASYLNADIQDIDLIKVI